MQRQTGVSSHPHSGLHQVGLDSGLGYVTRLDSDEKNHFGLYAVVLETRMETMRKINTQREISFAEIVHGRDASVRVTDDGLLFAVDLVMVVSGKDRDYAGNVLRGLNNELFNPLKFSERQLSTRGGPKTKLVSFQDAIELIFVIPGKNAKKTRSRFSNIIHRYIAGDQTLITEINENASLSLPVAQLARGMKRRYGEIDECALGSGGNV
jgi:hypothetical protein